jgi:hypothetical protein
MIRLIVVFFVLWLLTALGIRRAHMLKGRMAQVGKDFGAAFVAASIVTGLLILFVALF